MILPAGKGWGLGIEHSDVRIPLVIPELESKVISLHIEDGAV